MGLLQLRLPEAYGGPGANLTTICIAAEECAKVSESIALISGQNGIAMIVPLNMLWSHSTTREIEWTSK